MVRQRRCVAAAGPADAHSGKSPSASRRPQSQSAHSQSLHPRPGGGGAQLFVQGACRMRVRAQGGRACLNEDAASHRGQHNAGVASTAARRQHNASSKPLAATHDRASLVAAKHPARESRTTHTSGRRALLHARASTHARCGSAAEGRVSASWASLWGESAPSEGAKVRNDLALCRMPRFEGPYLLHFPPQREGFRGL